MADTVCIVGLGYVGLPLSEAFDRNGAHVIGYDIDESKVERLAAGEDAVGCVGDDAVADCDVQFTADPSLIGDAEYVIITVPTPVDDLQNPDMRFVEAAAETVGKQMMPETTVVLESTVFPGATAQVLVPALERTSDFTRGEQFNVAYSPERVAPGVTGRSVNEVVKLVGAWSPAVGEDVGRLYERIVDAGVVRTPDVETAEAAKVIENVQRDLNIALVNELAVACDHIGLDTHAVLDAAGTKWNFHDEYRPGLVGGHCIPVDPLYLTYRSEREGFSPKLILQAREINEYVPKHTANLAIRALNESGRVIKDSRLLVLGLAYKANVGDIRTSEVGGVISHLQDFGVDLAGYDPHADDAEVREAFGIEILPEVSLENFDGVLIATAHDEFADLDLETLSEELNADPLLIDVANQFDGETARDFGFVYESL
ncbi:nucleotide sugar dehydrogenase [Halobellus captivus]|uniref:nucleotide sugar dehydrogenase n=1 Tax=Halobellus captivus TaxID=2592614 RepID=UPI0011A91880|nr:nucleotide sugar dehydrogenase [Halobellus captivus]